MTAYRIRLFRPSWDIVSLFGVVVLLALAWPLSSVRAESSDMQILLDRLERLERDIRTLNRQIARAPQSASQADSQDVSSAVQAAPDASQNASAMDFAPNEGAMSRFTVRLSALEGEVRQATGQTESMSYRLDQLSERLDTLVKGLNYRFGRLEGTVPAGGPAGGQSDLGALEPTRPGVSTAQSSGAVSKVGEMAPPTGETPSTEKGTVDKRGVYTPPKSAVNALGSMSKTTLDQAETPERGAAEELNSAQTATASQASASPVVAGASTVLPAGTPRERYQYAFGLMSQARYDEAEAALKEFIAQHGEDPLVGNARYWLGESYYVRKSFMDAAQTFFQAYKTAPDGSKAADSLLKLGMSMANLDKPEEACATYGKLRKEFPDLKPNLSKALERETKRLKCE